MEKGSIITSTSNRLIKKMRTLKNRKGRAKSGLFLVEGLQHIGSAIEAKWDLELILYSPEMLVGEYAISLLESMHRSGLNTQPVSAPVLKSLAEKDNPAGILASVRQRRLSISDLNAINIGVALVSPQDPGNVGTIMRTLDAIGGKVLFVLDGGVDIYHPTCVRASMGTLFWISVIQATFNEFVRWGKKNTIKFIGTSAHAQRNYRDAKPGESAWVLLLGSEKEGLSDEQLSACAINVSMPMLGKASSLNLAVAAGVMLYALND